MMAHELTFSKTFTTKLQTNGCKESFLTILSGCDEKPSQMFHRLDESLRQYGGTVAKMDHIGLFNTSGATALEQHYCVDCAQCRLGDAAPDGSRQCPVRALQVHTVQGSPVHPVWLGGQIVGTIYEDAHARYCQLKDLMPDNCLKAGKQVRQVLERAELALRSVGMSFNDVIRTWFHLDRIFDWYGEFNQERDAFFRERGVFERLVPASTGVGGANRAGAALVCSLLAVQAKNGEANIRAVPSPLQCPALEYGSSFSRAIEMETPDHKRLFISGTASIEPGGKTVYVGDVDKQIELTMDVVMAILESRSMNWSDVTRAIGYVKDQKDRLAFYRYCGLRNLQSDPVVIVENDVCREDLLFELELDAVRGRGTSEFEESPFFEP